ncbi:hypothetical protein [Oceanitalea stevensii]|uniref:Uncharacterized protein n=1 Tax=Oceanitalea stevensii TaxID=2763072 RepID=A0ABR8Z3Q5_9MICO|nr:hypothetical protein [Oceanitalea stevensii]MBD8062945.1 hypothetical protein [Oceanitalea stevensii]
MSELPLSPFPPPAGLTMVGADDAAVCVDGVCQVPGDGTSKDDDGHVAGARADG